MEFSIIPDQDALTKCTWCKNYLTDEADAFGIGAKLIPDVDLADYETHCIEIVLGEEENAVYMLVTPEGSEAKNDGHDGMFLVCSKQCGNDLKAAMKEEIDSGTLFDRIKDIVE